MTAFVAIQSPLPTMMTHGANPSWRDWKDFSLLVMPIERAGTPLLMWMVESAVISGPCPQEPQEGSSASRASGAPTRFPLVAFPAR